MSSSNGHANPPPKATKAFWRGLTRRCPRCGQGHLFTSWFTMTDPCPRCGLRFEREEASFLGSLALNYGMTGVVFVVVLFAGVALTLPNIPLIPLMVASVGVALVFPLVFWPFAKTLWAAIDYLLMRAR